MKRACLDCGKPTTGSRCPTCAAAYKAPYRTAEYRRDRAELVGQPCELRLPGCTGIADTADHVIPKAIAGGRGPLRPACVHCNSSRGSGRQVAPDPYTSRERRRGSGASIDDPSRPLPPTFSIA